MNIISVKELREHFDYVKNAMREGQPLILVYRSKPIAEIRPIENKNEINLREKFTSNLKKVNALAGGLRLGKGLTPTQLNRLYDQNYG